MTTTTSGTVDSNPTQTTDLVPSTTVASTDRTNTTVGSTGTTQPSTASSSTEPELTADEALRINPPPPRNVSAQVLGGHVNLTWDEPPAVGVPHTYSDLVVGYRIYRRADAALEFEPIGTTAERSYVDSTVQSAHRYAYQVSSIREREVEGTRTDGVEVTVY